MSSSSAVGVHRQASCDPESPVTPSVLMRVKAALAAVITTTSAARRSGAGQRRHAEPRHAALLGGELVGHLAAVPARGAVGGAAGRAAGVALPAAPRPVALSGGTGQFHEARLEVSRRSSPGVGHRVVRRPRVRQISRAIYR